jgi:hypothetical protein
MTGAGLLRVTDGATAFIEGMLAVQNMALEPTGTVAGLGPLYVNASLDWSGGAMTGIGVTDIAAGAVLNIDGPDVKGLAGWGLDNAGQICWSGGDIDATGAGLSNQAGALLNMQADVSWLDPSRTSAWNNSGTIRKSGGTGTSEVDAAINDNGFVSVEAANVEFDGGGGLGGNIQVQQGVSLTLGAGVFNLLPGFTIAGNGVLVQGRLDGEDVGLVVGSNVTIPNFRMMRGTLMGAGNLVVNRMDWIGGNMADSGTTTVQSGGVMNVSNQDDISQGARTLVNQGTINWSGADGTAWQFENLIDNEGTFNISLGANDIAFLSGVMSGTFTNSRTGVLRQTSGLGSRLGALRFENAGLVAVNVGALSFQTVRGDNTGTFQIEAGASINLERAAGERVGSSMTFNLAEADPHMIRGDGWFIVQPGGVMVIPEFNIVTADNLALEPGSMTDPGGILSGLGTLVVNNLRWDGGTMWSGLLDPGDTRQGETEVPPGGTLTITGVADVTLDNRQLLNHGRVVWGLPYNGGNIVVQARGTIINDGGRFDVWNDQAIKNNGGRAGPFIVQNGGVFQKYLTEYLGTTTIEVAFQNSGGTVRLDGDAIFDNSFTQSQGAALTVFNSGSFVVNGDFQNNGGTIRADASDVTFSGSLFQNNGGTFLASGNVTFAGGFSQSDDTSLTVFGPGSYSYVVRTSFAVTGGRMQLLGGDLYFPTTYVNNSPAPNFSNAIFQGYGSLGMVNGSLGVTTQGILYTNFAQILMTGNLRVGALYLTNVSQVHLAGYTLTTYAASVNQGGSNIFLENGILTGFMSNGLGSLIQGPGRFRGTQLENAGVIAVGDLNQPGQLVIEGNLLEDATGTLRFALGANGFDQLVVLGHAVLAGTIQVALLNGFTPNVSPPDTFEVITCDSDEGSFADTSIDLGDGEYEQVRDDGTDVTLVTTL